MLKSKIQTGYISELEKVYIFTYDGELLQLVPKEKNEIKPYDFLNNSNKNLEILEGETQAGNKIFFLNCRLLVRESGYIAKPAGFILCDHDLDMFDTITFKSGIIDSFYRTNQIIDEKESYCNYQSGESMVKLKGFADTTKHYDVSIAEKRADLCLSITQPGLPLDFTIGYSLGRPKSTIMLTFENPVSISEFRSIYLWIYNLMIFLNFRRDVFMGEITLGRLTDDKRNEKIADTYILEKNKAEIENVDRIIGYAFIEEKIDQLLKIVNKPELNLLFIPKNCKEGKYLTPENYMICCTSFESVFNFVFPNARTEYSQVANEVKQEFLDYISDRKEAYKGESKKKRQEFQKYADMIKFLDFGLGEKFSYCEKEYGCLITDYKKQLLLAQNMKEEQLDEMAYAFGKKRNMLMHNSLEPFESVHVVAYSLARVFIYIMIMKKAGICDQMIIQAIDKVL